MTYTTYTGKYLPVRLLDSPRNVRASLHGLAPAEKHDCSPYSLGRSGWPPFWPCPGVVRRAVTHSYKCIPRLYYRGMLVMFYISPWQSTHVGQKVLRAIVVYIRLHYAHSTVAIYNKESLNFINEDVHAWIKDGSAYDVTAVQTFCFKRFLIKLTWGKSIMGQWHSLIDRRLPKAEL